MRKLSITHITVGRAARLRVRLRFGVSRTISGDPISDSAIVILRTARHVALVAAAGGLLAACKFGPVIVGYRTITVDPAAQRVDWQNPIQAEVDSGGLTRPTLGSYY